MKLLYIIKLQTSDYFVARQYVEGVVYDKDIVNYMKIYHLNAIYRARFMLILYRMFSVGLITQLVIFMKELLLAVVL